jgi:hypothetical protein
MKPREARRKVVIPARMRDGGAWVDVCIRDISSRGMLVQAASPPPRGTYIEIYKARHRIVARVVWRKERRFGVHTQDKLDIGAIIEDAALAVAAPAAGSAPPPERRADPGRLTAAKLAERAERNRRLSAMFEFGCVVACGLAAAAITVSAVKQTLSRPLQSISEQLQQVK